MKITNIINNFYRNVLLIKYRVFIGSFMMYIGLIYLAKAYINSVSTNIKVSIFDMLCDVYKGSGIVGYSRYIFPIIPLFVFVLISIIDINNKTVWLARYKSRKNIWNRQVVYTIYLSFIYSILIILGGYLASGVLIGSFNNKWITKDGFVYKLLGEPSNWSIISSYFTSYKILFFIFTSNFLGLCTIGLLICVAKTFLKNQYVCILLIISLFVSVLFDKFSIVLKQMTINLENWINPITIIKNDVYLILLILMLYVIGGWITDKRDIVDKI
ncbi:hypothetical protein [Clostridium sp.]|jgi:hypothetical protein|uniref:hypothetical protein n=1 Tax=Clostridium sp. TaxID=1506 RepID=UPI002582FF06|nr:hypothetical protein [Clostridium sp.]MDF2504703.1 putative rane protein [Clostridium sp.]